MFWIRETVSIGAPVGNPEGGSLIGAFERRMKRGFGNETSFIKLPLPTLWATPGL